MLIAARPSLAFLRIRLLPWLRAFSGIFLLNCSLSASAVTGQAPSLAGVDTSGPPSVHGTVLHSVTHEPVSRALVYTPGNQYATLTDDRGRFEFNFPAPRTEPSGNLPGAEGTQQNMSSLGRVENPQSGVFFARKPGYLPSENNTFSRSGLPGQREFTLYLVPESLIVGHVDFPGSVADVRIRVELYRREIREGREQWIDAGSATTWSDGEFRFSELAAGTYKLATTEQLDRDPSNFIFTPGEPLFGYPPIFYPATTDFSAAAPIQLAAGTTFQATLSPARREYFPVKIPVANGPTALAGDVPVEVHIHPLGHPGPGYSLGFNPAGQLIEGMLPNGSYTVQVDTRGQAGWMGIENFTVTGAPFEGSPLILVPNNSLNITVKEELESGQSNFQDVPADLAAARTNGGATRRTTSVQVTLFPIEDFGSGEAATSQQAGDQAGSLFIQNVHPGRYRVVVQSTVGYPASVSSNGSDLLREPLVIGVGGANAPIELTIRDDGAQVQGTIEEDAGNNGAKPNQRDTGSQFFVYFLPLDGIAQFRQTFAGDSGTFLQEQLPPGSYCVLVFDRQQMDLEYASEEATRKYESRGQVITVEAGQKKQLRVRPVREGEPQ
jgi:hypothetical protein